MKIEDWDKRRELSGLRTVVISRHDIMPSDDEETIVEPLLDRIKELEAKLQSIRGLGERYSFPYELKEILDED